MSRKADTGRTNAMANNNPVRPTGAEDLTTMDRDALLALTEAVFRWALRHTGLTRQQIIAQIERDGGTPP